MKDLGKAAFDEGFKMNNNCLCESKEKGEDRFVIMADDTHDCDTVMTGLPFQEVFIDLSECKTEIKKLEEEKECEDE